MKGVFVVIFLLMGVFGFQGGVVADEKSPGPKAQAGIAAERAYQNARERGLPDRERAIAAGVAAGRAAADAGALPAEAGEIAAGHVRDRRGDTRDVVDAAVYGAQQPKDGTYMDAARAAGKAARDQWDYLSLVIRDTRKQVNNLSLSSDERGEMEKEFVARIVQQNELARYILSTVVNAARGAGASPREVGQAIGTAFRGLNTGADYLGRMIGDYLSGPGSEELSPVEQGVLTGNAVFTLLWGPQYYGLLSEEAALGLTRQLASEQARAVVLSAGGSEMDADAASATIESPSFEDQPPPPAPAAPEPQSRLNVPDEETPFAGALSLFTAPTAPLTSTLNMQPRRVVVFEANAYDPSLIEQFGLQNTHVSGMPAGVGGGTALTFSASDQQYAGLQGTLCATSGVTCGNDTCTEIQLPSLERPFEEPNASAALQLAALGEGDDELTGRAREVENLPRFEEPPAIQLAALVTDTATIVGQSQDTQGNANANATLALFPDGDLANLVDNNAVNDPNDDSYYSGGLILFSVDPKGKFTVRVGIQYDTDNPAQTGSLYVITGESSSGVSTESLQHSRSGQAKTGVSGLGQVPTLQQNWTLRAGSEWASTSELIFMVKPGLVKE